MANLLNVNMEDKHTHTHTEVLRPLWCTPLFSDLWCISFSFFPKRMVYTIALFLLCDLKKENNRPKEEGRCGFFQCQERGHYERVFSLEESLEF